MFENCQDVNEVKIKYRDLVMSMHPDRHPQDEFDTWNRKTQELNAAYHEALKSFNKVKYEGTDDKWHTYHYKSEREQEIIDTIDELIRANLSDHIQIVIIGTWVWVVGTQREDKEDHEKLKAAGLSWHAKRKKWYKKPEGAYRRSYSGQSFEHLKSMYGARHVDRNAKEEEEDNPAIAG